MMVRFLLSSISRSSFTEKVIVLSNMMLPPPLIISTTIITDFRVYHNTLHGIFICILRFVGFPFLKFVKNAENRRGNPCGSALPLFAGRAGSLHEGIALGTFRYSRVRFMCADLDAVQTAIVLSSHVILALGNSAADVIILLHLVHDGKTFFL